MEIRDIQTQNTFKENIETQPNYNAQNDYINRSLLGIPMTNSNSSNANVDSFVNQKTTTNEGKKDNSMTFFAIAAGVLTAIGLGALAIKGKIKIPKNVSKFGGNNPAANDAGSIQKAILEQIQNSKPDYFKNVENKITVLKDGKTRVEYETSFGTDPSKTKNIFIFDEKGNPIVRTEKYSSDTRYTRLVQTGTQNIKNGMDKKLAVLEHQAKETKQDIGIIGDYTKSLIPTHIKNDKGEKVLDNYFETLKFKLPKRNIDGHITKTYTPDKEIQTTKRSVGNANSPQKYIGTYHFNENESPNVREYIIDENQNNLLLYRNGEKIKADNDNKDFQKIGEIVKARHNLM